MKKLVAVLLVVGLATVCGCSSLGRGGAGRVEAERPELGYERVGQKWVRKSDVVWISGLNTDCCNILQLRVRGKLLGKISPGAEQEFVISPGRLDFEITIDEAVNSKGQVITTARHSSAPLPVLLKGGSRYQVTISPKEPWFAMVLGRGSWTKLASNEIAWLSWSSGKCQQIVTREMVPIGSPTGESIEVDYQASAPRWLAATGLAERVPDKGMRFPQGLVVPKEVEASVGTEHTVFATEKGIYREYPWIRITRLPGAWLYLEEGKHLVEGKGSCPYSERRKPPHIPSGVYLRSGSLYLDFSRPATIVGLTGTRGTEILITPNDGRLSSGTATITTDKRTDVGNFIAEKGTTFQVSKTRRPIGQQTVEARILTGKIIPQHMPFLWRTEGYAASIKGKQRFYYQTDLGWVLVREL